MTTNADNLHQWTQRVLSQNYAPEQIREMGKGKPKLASYIPPTPYALEYAAKWTAAHNAKLAAAKVTQGHSGRLAREKLATAAEQERAERAEWKTRGLEAQVNGLLRGQRS
jgi:hypothetical protein